MVVSVNMGFPYVAVSMFVVILCTEISRKFRVWSLSASAVNCSFGFRLIKSSRIMCMLVWLESNISRMSSLYRQ